MQKNNYLINSRNQEPTPDQVTQDSKPDRNSHSLEPTSKYNPPHFGKKSPKHSASRKPVKRKRLLVREGTADQPSRKHENQARVVSQGKGGQPWANKMI